MGLKIGKYAFTSKKQALNKIKGLGIEIDDNGNEVPTHNHGGGRTRARRAVSKHI